MCGCGQKTKTATKTIARLGHVKGEPLRYINGHNRRKAFHDLYATEDRGFTTKCWIWQGGTDGPGQGYGVAWDSERGKNQMAHRLFWEKANGQIPKGLVLDHLCSVRRCVNPAHLELVTPGENNRRMWARRKANRGRALDLLDEALDAATRDGMVSRIKEAQRLLVPEIY
jgi:hypothetical protein